MEPVYALIGLVLTSQFYIIYKVGRLEGILKRLNNNPTRKKEETK